MIGYRNYATPENLVTIRYPYVRGLSHFPFYGCLAPPRQMAQITNATNEANYTNFY